MQINTRFSITVTGEKSFWVAVIILTEGHIICQIIALKILQKASTPRTQWRGPACVAEN